MSNAQMPSKAEIRGSLKEATKLDDHISKFLDVADEVNRNAIGDRDPSRMSLDDIPLGEEAVRLQEASEFLSKATETLEKALDNPSLVKPLQVQRAIETIDDVKSTCDECGPTPKVSKPSDW